MQNKKILKKTLSYITALFIIGFLTYTGKQIHAMADTTVYFEWCENQKETEPAGSFKKLTKVKAYATSQADVVELYGITRADIHDFLDNGQLIFEMKSVTTDMGTQFFRDITLPHLPLVLLTSVNSSPKLFFVISPEDSWYFSETEECVRVYFAQKGFDLETINSAVKNAENVLEGTEENAVKKAADLENTEAIEKSDATETIRQYPDNVFVLPVSEKADSTQFKLQDNYHEKKFVITLPGNYLEFYEQNPVINPYSYVTETSITYDEENQQTVIQITTETICACKYTLEDGYIAMTIAKPDEIYDKIIILDAGHGGKDPGALQGTILEKDINFKIVCTYLKNFFENSDIKVYYTRETDTYISLSERADLAAEVGADLFISLHMNTFTSSSANGTQVYYSSANNKKLSSGFSSSVLAKKLVNKISTAIGTKNRGCTDANYYVTKYNSVPAVLIELGFMTNKSDLAKLTSSDYQEKAAQAIYEAVTELYAEYFTE